jgi:ParB-like chromosome segregation protein Spo0J
MTIASTPYSDAMPPLSPREFNELVESIKANGVLVPILVDENGVVIDGHQRRAASQAAGVTPPTTTLDLTGKSDDERRAIAIAVNAIRRQMSVEQRRQAVTRMKELGLKNKDIAKATGTSVATVKRDVAESGGSHEPTDSDPAKDKAIAASVKAGKTTREAAEEHGVSQTTAVRATKRASKPKPKTKKKEKPTARTQPRITEFLNYLRTLDATQRVTELRRADERLHEFFVKNLIDCPHNH